MMITKNSDRALAASIRWVVVGFVMVLPTALGTRAWLLLQRASEIGSSKVLGTQLTPGGDVDARRPRVAGLVGDELAVQLAHLGHRRQVRANPVLGDLARRISVFSRLEDADRCDHIVLVLGLDQLE